MKFILNEVKLWFKGEEFAPKSYYFLPNKINVITGDATTGKTSFWRIIDYCLLSNRTTIANTIVEKVSWFGIHFTINNKEISIARKSPTKGAIGSDVFFVIGSLPTQLPIQNMKQTELKQLLDAEFGITDNLRFPYGKELGKSPFNLTYRYFLLFSSLTEDIIGSSETYFDTTFYGKEEYDSILKHVFDMVIGVNNMENIKAQERLKIIGNEIANITRQNNKNQTSEKKFQNGLISLLLKLKENNLVEHSYYNDSTDEILALIDKVILSTRQSVDASNLLSEIDRLNKARFRLRTQISSIEKYKREYAIYKRNLKKTADSLKPITLLNSSLSDQLVESYESRIFIETLESSLKEIQNSLSNSQSEPIKISEDSKAFQLQLRDVESRIRQLTEMNKGYLAEGNKFMIIGEVKNEREQLIKNRRIIPANSAKLSDLTIERENLTGNINDIGQIKFVMKKSLNDAIQKNYAQLTSLPAYKDCETLFNDAEMRLQLRPQGQLFTLDNVGSKSNYMFMHLCFYLGLHEHIIKVSPEHVPQFLFIDQPSIPYYSGGDSIGNNDKAKLLDAFTLLNSFISRITMKEKIPFQIFMVEHAPKEYWLENNLNHFHTVAEFINGNGLIPNDIYND